MKALMIAFWLSAAGFLVFGIVALRHEYREHIARGLQTTTTDCGEHDPRWISRVSGSTSMQRKAWQCGQVDLCSEHRITCPGGEKPHG